MLKSSILPSEKSRLQMKRSEHAPLPLNNQEITSLVKSSFNLLGLFSTTTKKVIQELRGISWEYCSKTIIEQLL